MLEGVEKEYNFERPTSQEVLDLVKATGGVGAGHVYKCTKCGYVYVIGECGGAMERSKCPGCGGGIGGTDHRADGTTAWAGRDFDTTVERGHWQMGGA